MSQYFTPGIPASQSVYESLIIQAIDFMGVDFIYIPRTLVYVDDIFTEDRLSEYKNKYAIRGYWEQVDNFGGQGAFIAKFGLQMEQSGKIVIARQVWEKAVGKYGQTILSNRPAEGDLIYWPLSGGLFEIKFVQHQDPFYQLGRLYVYKLEVELFQYASERINTGMPAVDVFEDLKSHDTFIINNQPPAPPATPNPPPAPQVPQPAGAQGDNAKFIAAAPTIGFNTDNIFGDV